MDNRVTKKRISDHLEYDWYKYLALVAAAIAVIAFTFSQIYKDKDDESFNLFLSGYEYYGGEAFTRAVTDGQKADGYDAAAYGPPILRSVAVEFQDPSQAAFGELYATHALISSDAVIAPLEYLRSDGGGEGAVPEYGGAFAYLALDEKILGLAGVSGGGYELLRLDENARRVSGGGRIAGIRVDNAAKIKDLVSFSAENQPSEFYLFINPSGANIGTYKSKRNKRPENMQTFFCLKIFFGLYG
ncbi:MAG: hypothetical protein LBP26_02035 [Clostridiales bacterium]|jgi:hypothetical protein|nr:hypothetical protein [Clostridiales bacterium]